jgi:hypothetical protein
MNFNALIRLRCSKRGSYILTLKTLKSHIVLNRCPSETGGSSVYAEFRDIEQVCRFATSQEVFLKSLSIPGITTGIAESHAGACRTCVGQVD